jgi:hypothetical protein
MPDAHNDAALAWLLRRLCNPFTEPARRDEIAMYLLRLAGPDAHGAGEAERRLMEDAGGTLRCKLARFGPAETG